MTALVHNLTVEQGGAFSRLLTWKSDGVPVDLTGYTARFIARPAYGSTATILDLTTANGGIVLGGAAGTIQITASDEITDAIVMTGAATGTPPKLFGVHNLTLTDAGGRATRLMEGQITVTAKV